MWRGKEKLWKNRPHELSIPRYKPVQLMILVGRFCVVGVFELVCVLKNATIS